MIRAFIALPLPEALRLSLYALSLQLPLPRRVPTENLHLTLAFLGDQSEPDLEELHFRLEAIDLPRFTLTPRGTGHFGGDEPRSAHACIQPEPALDRLHTKIAGAVRQSGLTMDMRRFVPHITLGRFKRGEADRPRLERALIETAGFTAAPVQVDRFALYQSHLARGGPDYVELASYPLA